MKFEFLEHTADVKFRAYGKTLEEVFENSVLAMIKSICEDKVKKKKEIKIKIKGKDLEGLLYNFLEELIFLFDSEGFLVAGLKEMKIDLERKELNCILLGDKAESYEIFSHVKAITYNEMFVKKVNNKYVVQVVLDI